MADSNIIADLPKLRWRNLDTPPYDMVTFEFNNELSPRQIPYLDGDVHDWTGRRSFPMTARLFFLNTIGRGRLFPDLFEQWKLNLDGEVGELFHPVLGPIPARIQGAKGEIRSTTRAGVIMDVTWVETIVDPAEGDNLLIVLQSDPTTLAAAADVAWQAFQSTYPRMIFLDASFGANPTLSDAWGSIRTQLFAPSPTTGVALGQLLDVIDEMVATIEALDNNDAWMVVDTIISFWVAVKDYAERVQRAVRPTAREVIRQDTTLDAFATRRGNDLSQLMGLNLNLLRSPIVPRGATITYYL